ncbi:MAG: GGDEF domain-containing protein [Pseudomonadales bacterium]
MQIKFARRDRALLLVIVNVILTGSLMAHLYAISPQYVFNFREISFEIASFLSVFIMFVAATLIKVTLAERRMVLSGLFALQTGNLLDSANGIFYSTQTHWWLIGDGLTFLGEIILALVVFQFVRLTNNLTNRDPLTGLYNRSFHMRELAQLLKNSHRKKESLTVIAVDIDHFKHVNDVYGHAFGDLALQLLAKKVQSFDQQAKLISRTGGEEFEIVADGLDEPAAVSLAEKIRGAIAEIDLGEDRRLTASLGVSLSHVGEALASLRQRADAAAYKAKNTGRNRVCIAD